MQILFLAHRIPYPPDKGEKIRAFHELQFLAADHEIDLFTLADSAEEAKHADLLRPFCRHVHVSTISKVRRLGQMAWNLLTATPVSCGYFYSRKLAEELRKRLQVLDYDLIFVYSSSMAQFIPAENSVPVVIDFVDADSAKWEQYSKIAKPPLSWIYGREARTLAKCEARIASRAAVAIACTDADAQQLHEVSGRQKPIHVIRNGTELRPHSTSQVEGSLREMQPFAAFIGTMNYRPNVEAVTYFAESILPMVRRSCPELRFVIVGRNPSRRVRRLASLPGVIVTGSVPDVYPYLHGAALAVAPFSISQGFHNKIAEALAVGTPVVSTSRAAAGIGLQPIDGLFSADDTHEFARKVVAIVRDVGLRATLQRRADVVRGKLSWNSHLLRLEQLLHQAAAGRVRPEERIAVSS